MLLPHCKLVLQFGFFFASCSWLSLPGSASVNTLNKGPLIRRSSWPKMGSLSILGGIAMYEGREFGYMVTGLLHLDR